MTIVAFPNLARRKTVRFWTAWLGMLATTLPAWTVPLLVAMAFPLVKDGKLGFNHGVLAFGTCAGCGCASGGGGGGCGSGVTCAFCNASGDNTPLLIDAVASGIPVGECCSDPHAPPRPGIVTQDVNGAYQLAQGGGVGCVWGKLITVNPYVAGPPDLYFNSTCSGSPIAAHDGSTGVQFYTTRMTLTRQSSTAVQCDVRIEMTRDITPGAGVTPDTIGVNPFRGLNTAVTYCNTAFSIMNGTDTTAVCGSGTGTITFTCTP